MTTTTSQIIDSRRLGSSTALSLWLRLLPFIRYLVDFTGLCLLFIIFVIAKTNNFPDSYRIALSIAMMAHAVVYAFLNVYSTTSQISSFRGLTQILSAWSVVALALLALAFVTKTSETYSRQVFIQWLLAAPLFQYFVWWVVRHLSKSLARDVAVYNRSAVIGVGQHAEKLIASLLSFLETETLIGVIQDYSDQPVKEVPIRLLGNLDNLRDIVHGNRIRKIYIALDSAGADKVEEIQLELLDLNVDVIWVPDMRSYSLVNHSIYNLGGNPAIAINQSPLTSPGPGPLFKSIMDKVLASLALVVLSPLLIVISLLVKMTSSGPVIFKQKRHGFDGEIIEIWKFRSMRIHQEHQGQITQAKKQDDRITPIGKFIRKTSIDELPQFINVLQGRMSLVGPRPHALEHNDLYSKKIDAYLVRHRMKPGITGLAQISGYRGETDTLEKMERRIAYDLAYINNWTLMLDIKILLKTPLALLRGEAY